MLFCITQAFSIFTTLLSFDDSQYNINIYRISMVDTANPAKNLAELKRQLVCTDHALKDFNWKLNMPLDYSQVQKDDKVVLDHTQVKEGQVIRKDVRAPIIEFTFDLNTDATKGDAIDSSAKVNFNKVNLQQLFEEMEKIQLKLDELTN